MLQTSRNTLPASGRRIFATGLALLGISLAAASIGHQGSAPQTPEFLRSALGESTQAAGWRHSPAPGVHVTVGRSGTVVRAPGERVSLTATGAGSSAWQGFAAGAARPTPFGSETVVVGRASAEESLTVAAHHG